MYMLYIQEQEDGEFPKKLNRLKNNERLEKTKKHNEVCTVLYSKAPLICVQIHTVYLLKAGIIRATLI